MSWSGRDGLPQWRDLTVLAGRSTPLAVGRPVGHTFDAEGTQHAVYNDNDFADLPITPVLRPDGQPLAPPHFEIETREHHQLIVPGAVSLSEIGCPDGYVVCRHSAFRPSNSYASTEQHPAAHAAVRLR